MEQTFHCGDCNLETAIALPDGLDEDAITVFRRYRVEHDRQSPDCQRATRLVADMENMIVEGAWPHSPQAGVLN
jgi:hypothetical protein